MRIIESDKTIKNNIVRIFKKQVYKKLRDTADQIENHIKIVNLQIWKSTETYNSLLYGRLNHEFGFPKGSAQGIVDAALLRVSKSIRVIPKMIMKNALTIEVLQKDFNFLYDTDKIQIEQDDPDKKDELAWFEWLTFEGNKYIIWKYEYVDEISPRSRSGRGIMKFNKDEAWRVPEEFSGTKESNWLTRALEENTALQSAYAGIIEYYLTR